MYRQSMFANEATRNAFADDVLEMLGARYALEDGTIIEGQAFSFLQSLLRDGCRASGGRRRWTLPGGYGGFRDALEEAGFKVIRARSMRYTRTGAFKPYQMCDVVTL